MLANDLPMAIWWLWWMFRYDDPYDYNHEHYDNHYLGNKCHNQKLMFFLNRIWISIWVICVGQQWHSSDPGKIPITFFFVKVFSFIDYQTAIIYRIVLDVSMDWTIEYFIGWLVSYSCHQWKQQCRWCKSRKKN